MGRFLHFVAGLTFFVGGVQGFAKQGRLGQPRSWENRIVNILPKAGTPISDHRNAIFRFSMSSSDNDNDTAVTISEETVANERSTPLDRPLLATVDLMALLIFSAIGKASHSAGGINALALLSVAFPFVVSWYVTSPLTGVYDSMKRHDNLLVDTVSQVAKGWIVAIPLGCVVRSAIKGYLVPLPFVIVTMLSTLVILVGGRMLFALAEDFFVELV